MPAGGVAKRAATGKGGPANGGVKYTAPEPGATRPRDERLVLAATLSRSRSNCERAGREAYVQSTNRARQAHADRASASRTPSARGTQSCGGARRHKACAVCWRLSNEAVWSRQRASFKSTELAGVDSIAHATPRHAKALRCARTQHAEKRALSAHTTKECRARDRHAFFVWCRTTLSSPRLACCFSLPEARHGAPTSSP